MLSVSEHLQHIKTLIIDNYDSYTFNLLQLCPNDKNVIVIRNDQFNWEEFKERILPFVDNIIISPGPGRPERPTDFGICTPLLKAQLDPEQYAYHRPIFGVCLGHQGIGYLLGGKVTYATRIMHGRMSQVHHYQPRLNSVYKDVLDNCASPFWAVRYHSLVVDKDSLPNDLVLTAYCYEDDKDMDALKNATYLEDKEDQQEEGTGDAHHHYLPHPSPLMAIEDEVEQLAVKDAQRITVMGFQHKTLPLWGVQFHPESVSTEHGHTMILNFLKETYRWMVEMGNRPLSTQPLKRELQLCSVATPTPVSEPEPPSVQPQPSTQLYVKACSKYVSPEFFVNEMMKDPEFNQRKTSMAWLDSSRKSSPYSRMSILSIDPALTITYSTLHREVHRLKRGKGQKLEMQTLPEKTTFFDYISDALEQQKQKIATDPLWVTQQIESDENEQKERNTSLSFRGGFVGYFGYEMKRESMDGYSIPEQQRCTCPRHGTSIPRSDNNCCCACVQEPDAAFQFLDRYFIFDHSLEQIYICCLVDTHQNEPDDVIGFHQHEKAMLWIGEQEETVFSVFESLRKQKFVEEFTGLTPVSSTCTTPIPPLLSPSSSSSTTGNLFKADADHQQYLQNIEKCINYIREGESYELCLTTRFRCNLSAAKQQSLPPLFTDQPNTTLGPSKTGKEDIATICGQLYTHYLRKNNPAPFSALLLFSTASASPSNDNKDLPQTHYHEQSFGILSSSPERFLKVDQNRIAEMKPIKGTIRRVLHCACPKDDNSNRCDLDGPDCEAYRQIQDNARKQQLWQDVKERAENLMIVDLIRNDLAQVCSPVSVCVPKLMHIETYEKVHHLVSTVRGTLYPHVTAVKALQTCFPPGSMTGAPKLRSVQLLDELEGHKTRGVYSGCLGYFSLDGSADFNVVIRTAVVVEDKEKNIVEVSVGGGGAVTFLSDPEQEWREALLKTTSVAPSVQEFLDNQ